MKRFLAILGLTVVALLSPMTGQAQWSALHRSYFKIDKLSTRKDGETTWVDGEVTNNAKKEASLVSITVRWFDKDGNVVDHYNTFVSDLAPGETLPFQAYTRNPEGVQYAVTVDSASAH